MTRRCPKCQSDDVVTPHLAEDAHPLHQPKPEKGDPKRAWCRACNWTGPRYETWPTLERATGQMAVSELRCWTTGNPCGTDTWMAGSSCPCDPCQKWVAQHPELADLAPSSMALTLVRFTPGEAIELARPPSLGQLFADLTDQPPNPDGSYFTERNHAPLNLVGPALEQERWLDELLECIDYVDSPPAAPEQGQDQDQQGGGQ